MGKYDEEIALAHELITEFGMSVQWAQPVDIVNADEPWKAANGTPRKFKVDIAFVPVKDNEWRKLLAHMKGTEIPKGRVGGLMAGGQKFKPTLKDHVIRSGKTLLIENIDAFAPADQDIFYIIEFRE